MNEQKGKKKLEISIKHHVSGTHTNKPTEREISGLTAG